MLTGRFCKVLSHNFVNILSFVKITAAVLKYHASFYLHHIIICLLKCRRGSTKALFLNVSHRYFDTPKRFFTISNEIIDIIQTNASLNLMVVIKWIQLQIPLPLANGKFCCRWMGLFRCTKLQMCFSKVCCSSMTTFKFTFGPRFFPFCIIAFFRVIANQRLTSSIFF